MITYDDIERYSVEHLTDLKGKRVLVRIDVNTSLGDNGVVDPGEDWRIVKSYTTIDYLITEGASVVLISHIGRDPEESLKPIYDFMSRRMTIGFIPRYDDELMANTLDNMAHGSVVMLENVRSQPGEEANDSSFLNAVIERCDLYVNDAFSVSHRAHASVADVTTTLPSYFGLQFCDEVKNLASAIEGEFVLVLGGAKFGTKLDLLRKFLPKVSYVLLGGALANVFLRDRGFEVGTSFVDDVDISDMLKNKKIVLPVDIVDQEGDIVSIDGVGPEDIILDIGPETERLFETVIAHAPSIIWNGPMGKYEEGYISGSVAVADAVARSQTFSVTGGGDTATVILEENLVSSFDFISTGGGAMLEFLVEGTLPGIEAITQQKNDA